MELFFEYDLNRLRAYGQIKENRNRIEILEEENFTAFCFPSVSYFNYAFANNNQLLNLQEFLSIKEFYRYHGISVHKFIGLSGLYDDSFLSGLGYHKKNVITQTKYLFDQQASSNYQFNTQFVEVTNTELKLFTHTYLEGFNAIGRDVNEVYANFQGLYSMPGTKLYLVKNENDTIGIVVLYELNHHYFLAAGAILLKYQGHNHHKAGIMMRIKKCLMDANLNSIISWAYKGSISHHNMNRLNMIDLNEFDNYEFTV